MIVSWANSGEYILWNSVDKHLDEMAILSGFQEDYIRFRLT